jgi:hypothetical protein
MQNAVRLLELRWYLPACLSGGIAEQLDRLDSDRRAR